MKRKSFFVKKVMLPLLVLITMISCFYTISLMNNDNIVKAMEQEREDILMLQEAYKWIDSDDIDPSTGKLKEGVIYNIGENNRFYTSNGFQKYDMRDKSTTNNVNPMTDYKTDNPTIYINYKQDRNEILFSNNFMVDFDITYDEKNLNIEKKKYNLVKTEYTQSSHKEERSRLVFRSKRVKIGWFKITLWYPAIEKYNETVVVTTPIQTYDEVVEHVGSINLDEDRNILTKTTAKLVDKYFPSIREMSNTYGIPVLIMLLDTIVRTVVNVVKQILSIVADFIPVLDEIKTSYETVKGKDMFTGEEIGTFWRIFGGIMLVVGLVISFVTFGAGGVAVDAATDTAQTVKKGKKLASKADDVAGAAKKLDNTYDGIKKMDGFSDASGNVVKYVSKNSDEVLGAMKKLDGDTVADLIEQGSSATKKIDNALDIGSSGTKKLANGVEITKVEKSSDVFNLNKFDRGFNIDDYGGNNLGRTFKTVDKLDETTDTVTSIKSLDTRASTYQNASKFKSTVNKYLDQVDATQFGKKGGRILEKGQDFTKTAVDLYIPKEGLNLEQLKVIENIKLKKDIILRIFVLS